MSSSAAAHPDAPRGKALRLYLLRHGEPMRRDLFYGHYDIALSERGQAQAEAQGRALADSPVEAVYTSDLSRARFGAEAVARPHGLSPVVDPALREMHLGRLENVPYADGLRNEPALAGRSYRDMLDFRMPEGGESVRDVGARVMPVVDAVARRHASEHRPRVVLVAHNTVTRVVLSHAATGSPDAYGAFSQSYGAINRVDLPVVDEMVQWERASIVYVNRDPRWQRAEV
ncbi:MAG: histidine phosphatase family protein [Myxococcota bacterium]